MTEKIYYLELTDDLCDAFWLIEMNFPCFTEYEDVEMNYVKATICARTEDISHIEDILAPYI